MKTFPLHFLFWFAAFSLAFCGCQSSRPALLLPGNSEAFTIQTSASNTGPNNPKATFQLEQYTKTLTQTPEKVLYTANIAHPEPIAAQPAASQKNNFSAATPVLEQPEKTAPVIKKKQDEPEKVRGRWLSGVFLAAGMALLLLALVLVITGTSGAGTVALIGGGTFLAGFIFAMVALLGR